MYVGVKTPLGVVFKIDLIVWKYWYANYQTNKEVGLK